MAPWHVPAISCSAPASVRSPTYRTCRASAISPASSITLRCRRSTASSTAAAGAQLPQEAAGAADHLTVFQRTPTLALPRRQKQLDEDAIRRMKDNYPEMFDRRTKTFAGFDYDVLAKSALEVSEDERQATFERLWEIGGFAPWIGSFNDILLKQESNRAAYKFWRDKTLKRIKDPAVAEILAPAEPIHPFGVKRPSLEPD